MKTKLVDHRYGKSRVRLTKVDRDSEVHQITELSVDVELDGDFTAAFQGQGQLLSTVGVVGDHKGVHHARAGLRRHARAPRTRWTAESRLDSSNPDLAM